MAHSTSSTNRAPQDCGDSPPCRWRPAGSSGPAEGAPGAGPGRGACGHGGAAGDHGGRSCHRSVHGGAAPRYEPSPRHRPSPAGTGLAPDPPGTGFPLGGQVAASSGTGRGMLSALAAANVISAKSKGCRELISRVFEKKPGAGGEVCF